MIISIIWKAGLAGLVALALFACTKNSPEPEPEPGTEEAGARLPPARVSAITHDDRNGMTICEIEYPSSDPGGQPATLSGVITFGDEVNARNPAQGIMLFHRSTAFGRADTPSGGYLLAQKVLAGSGLVCVSADLYGFGVTDDKCQAYCMGGTNAQASIDALLAARELLPGLGVRFDWGKSSQVFNMGYSQGAQTAIAALKLTADQYPDIRFTHTFAGSGPYDLEETYRFLLRKGEATMPATIIAALYSFNEICHLGYSMADLFRESVISDIEKYVLSKDYSRGKVAGYIPAQPLQNLFQDDLMNPESAMCQRFMEAFGKENLCTGWQPRKHERIFLSSNPRDDVVPPSNTENLYRFLTEEKEMTNVEWYSSSGISPLIPETVPRHVAAAADYFLRVMGILRSRYGITWLPDIAEILEEAA